MTGSTMIGYRPERERRRRGRTALPIALAVVILGSCSAPTLELQVFNEGAEDAQIRIESEGDAPPSRAPHVLYTQEIGAGDRETITVEEPGPEPWTLYVNGRPVVDSSEWPFENPTLDFVIVVHADGTADLRAE